MTISDQPANNDINDQIESIDREIESLKAHISDNNYMKPEEEEDIEKLVELGIKFGELCAKRDNNQGIPDGFILVKKESISSFYQDNEEPENCCNKEADFDALGDCIEHDEIMIVNKHTSANISTEKLFGAWGVTKTPNGLTSKFMVFKSEKEAEDAIAEAHSHSIFRK